jgi:hypothetical protein
MTAEPQFFTGVLDGSNDIHGHGYLDAERWAWLQAERPVPVHGSYNAELRKQLSPKMISTLRSMFE